MIDNFRKISILSTASDKWTLFIYSIFFDLFVYVVISLSLPFFFFAVIIFFHLSGSCFYKLQRIYLVMNGIVDANRKDSCKRTIAHYIFF